MTDTPKPSTPIADVAPAQTRPPDRPTIPRPRRSVLTAVATGVCALVVVGYAVLAYSQHEFGSEDRDTIPKGMRSTPGGYRTYSYWHSGYHGGK